MRDVEGTFAVEGDAALQQRTRRDLAESLIRNEPRLATVKDEKELSPEQRAAQAKRLQPMSRWVRLWVGEALAHRNEARAVPLLSSIVNEAKAPLGAERFDVLLAVEKLSDYYRANRKFEDSIATWLKMDALFTDNGWRAEIRVEAARDYMKMGQAEKAKELYDQVPAFGFGWFTGMALWDQANTLVQQGKHEEARQLLQRPISAAPMPSR